MHTVVVIEDEPDICEFLKDVLESAGVSVCCAATGALGVEMLQQKHFDLALVDVDLPDASGIAIAEIAVNKDVPAVLMSGNLRAIDDLAVWGLPCLEKPFPLTSLEQEVARVMSDRRAQILRVQETVARLRATIRELDKAFADARRLIDVSRSLIDQATSSSPIVGG